MGRRGSRASPCTAITRMPPGIPRKRAPSGACTLYPLGRGPPAAVGGRVALRRRLFRDLLDVEGSGRRRKVCGGAAARARRGRRAPLHREFQSATRVEFQELTPEEENSRDMQAETTRSGNAALVAAARAGDRGAFDELYRNYARMVHGILL